VLRREAKISRHGKYAQAMVEFHADMIMHQIRKLVEDDRTDDSSHTENKESAGISYDASKYEYGCAI